MRVLEQEETQIVGGGQSQLQNLWDLLTNFGFPDPTPAPTPNEPL